MSQASAAGTTVSGLHDRLRIATRSSHRRLEAALGLADPDIAQGRVVHVLERFHGFHAAWEPSLAGVIPDSIRLPRLKAPLLREDLAGFGVSEERLHDLPLCREASALCVGEAEAAGALYVLEGSTLGGRVISRAIENVAWLDGRGVRYWNAYGEDTGRRWRETLAYLEALPLVFRERTVATAVATFDVLSEWFDAPAPAFGNPAR